MAMPALPADPFASPTTSRGEHCASSPLRTLHYAHPLLTPPPCLLVPLTCASRSSARASSVACLTTLTPRHVHFRHAVSSFDDAPVNRRLRDVLHSRQQRALAVQVHPLQRVPAARLDTTATSSTASATSTDTPCLYTLGHSHGIQKHLLGTGRFVVVAAAQTRDQRRPSSSC